MFLIIDRYVSKLFVAYFLGGILVFISLFLAIDFMTNFNRFAVSTAVLISYYTYLLPEIIYQMIPVACLVATVFTLSKLHKSNELVSLYSAGMSLARVCSPILVIVTIISAISFWSADRLLPVFSRKKNYIMSVEIKKKPGLYSTVKTDKIWYRSDNILYNIKTLNPQAKTAEGISLYYFDDLWSLVQTINAEKVSMIGEKWKLLKGSVTVFTKELSYPLSKKFEEKTIIMNDEITDLSSVVKSTDKLSLKDLSRFIKKNKGAGLDTVHYEVDYHSKFSYAFAAFVMSILGIPFSLGGGVRSKGAMKNVGLCIGVAFLYWSFYSSFLTLGGHGAVAPILAAWVPNLSMILVSLVMLVRLKR